MTQIRLTPTAVRSGKPSARVRSGTIRTPPPSPSSEPNRPVATPPTSSSRPSPSGLIATGAGPGQRAVARAVAGPARPCLWPEVLRGVRQERDDPGALERHRQLTLVLGARAGLPARLDLRP